MTLERWIETNEPKKIARQLRVEPTTISYWKSGKNFPGLKNLVKLQKLTGISYADLVKHFAAKRKLNI